MKNCLMDQFSKEELQEIVSNSTSYVSVLKKIGYKSNSGDATKTLREKLNSLGIDTSHFFVNQKDKIVRTRENVFCENSTANQSTLRRFFKKEDVPYVCSICGQEPFWNGKELTLILDHIDGNNTNDVLENLRWVCPNCNMQLDTTNGKNKFHYIEKHIRKNNCEICGKEISKHSKYCADCAKKVKKAKRKKETILKHNLNRQQLKEEIRTYSFLELGRKYNVSDNAVRKWCKLFDLPYKNISKYSEEEWETI